jgi:uncharacterized protein (UPF0264 family)
MTRLLVSVRGAAEAEICLRCGVDLIDVKEPLRGALGAADAAVIEEVVALVAGRAPVSAALGELLDLEDARREEIAALPAGLRYAKLGLAGAGGDRQWPARLARALEALPPGVSPVAVAYADWQAAGAPSPREVLSAARELRAAAVLLDTWDKRRGDLFTACSLDDVVRLIDACRRMDAISVIGGSLRGEAICRVVAKRPDFVAVRGAACRGGREGGIDADLVASLQRALAGGEGGKNSQERIS